MTSQDPRPTAHRGNWHRLPGGFDRAALALPDALAREGFGIITQVDLQQTFQAKLQAAFRRYRIFGACNPAFALKAVETDPRVGILLPCNIALFEHEDGSAELGVIDPMLQLGASEGPLAEVAHTISAKLARVAESVRNESQGGAT